MPKPLALHEAGPLPNGHYLWWEHNGVGGRRYWSDEVGGGVVVWDTALVEQSTILAALVEEERLRIREFYEKQQEASHD